jgi:hypothetical protein
MELERLKVLGLLFSHGSVCCSFGGSSRLRLRLDFGLGLGLGFLLDWGIETSLLRLWRGHVLSYSDLLQTKISRGVTQ